MARTAITGAVVSCSPGSAGRTSGSTVVRVLVTLLALGAAGGLSLALRRRLV